MNGVFHRMNGEDPRRFHGEQGTAAIWKYMDIYIHIHIIYIYIETIERRIFADLATTDVHNFGHRRSLARSNQNVNDISCNYCVSTP